VTDPQDDLPTAPESPAAEIDFRQAEIERGFFVLQCADAPVPAGAFIAVSTGPNAKPQILGRGAGRADDDLVRLSASLRRPGENRRLPPFENASLSRAQLEVTPRPNGFFLRNVGKCSLSINGTPAQTGAVSDGDLVQIGQQLLLLCASHRQVSAPAEPVPVHGFGEPDALGIVGESSAVWRLRRELAFAAAHSGHVLILGASGTGKELAANAIHVLSRAGKPWVARNASTLPEALVDAELFGNARNYPNPGMPERAGLVGSADRGTLFLDEFAELPLSVQTHFLRVLDDGEYQRLGESGTRRAGFRLVAATNRPVSDLRTDLLARFSFRIELPELRARREDIPLLARHLLKTLLQGDSALRARFSTSGGAPVLGPEFMAALVQRRLSGNVREVRNLLWDALGKSENGVLPPPPPEEPLRESAPSEPPSELERPGDELDAERVRAALVANGGSIEKTWRTLGLSSRFALMRLMKKNAIQIQKLPGRA